MLNEDEKKDLEWMTIMSKKYLQPDPKKIEIFSIDCDSESDDAEEEEDAESIAQRDIGR